MSPDTPSPHESDLTPRPRLEEAIARLSEAPSLLVVSDFDGTLAGLGPDPLHVPVNQEALAALQALSRLPRTEVAILSGRALTELQQLCPLEPPVHRIGSHGAEPEGTEVGLTREQEETLAAVAEQLEELCRGTECFVEYKPFQRVLHYRPVAGTPLAATIRKQALAVDPHGASVLDGKQIVEFSVATQTKGTWIAAELERLDPDQAVFLGDDATDELGFAALNRAGFAAGGVKVGPGDTQAAVRLADIDAVGEFFSQLAAARRSFHQGQTR